MITIEQAMWGFVVLGLYSNLMVINKNANGFILWFVTNTAWMAYNAYNGVWSQSVLFGIYNVFAVYGFYQWKYKKVN